MGLSINTNVAALNAYRNLGTTQNDLSKSLEKLSSGLRINRAADDAAGLAISEGLRAQIGGTKQAVRNAQDGISVVQTAEGALTETHSILQRMRTLSVQAANDGGLSSGAKQNIQDEITELTSELDRIADTTQFNGTKLLDGNYNANFQVGANVSESDKINVSITSVSAATLGVGALDVTTAGTAGGFGSTTAAAAFASVGDWAADGGTMTVAGETVDLSTVTDGASLAAAINTAAGSEGVTASWSATTGLSMTSAATFTVAATDGTGTEVAPTFTAVAATTAAPSGADTAIGAIDDAISSVSSLRSKLGAVQNRFDHTINNLNVSVENLSASESRIRDTDMAQEMVQFTRSQILSQAGTAMLAQAKNLPQSVLSLLQ